MKHELEFIGKNLKAINKMLKSVGGKPLKGEYWSSSGYSYYRAWYSTFNGSFDLDWYDKDDKQYVRPIFCLWGKNEKIQSDDCEKERQTGRRSRRHYQRPDDCAGAAWWAGAYNWYDAVKIGIPTKNEWMAIAENLDTVNKALIKAGGEPLKKSWYWSSSENDDEWAWNSYLNLSYGLGYLTKYNIGYVRPVLAF